MLSHALTQLCHAVRNPTLFIKTEKRDLCDTLYVQWLIQWCKGHWTTNVVDVKQRYCFGFPSFLCFLLLLSFFEGVRGRHMVYQMRYSCYVLYVGGGGGGPLSVFFSFNERERSLSNLCSHSWSCHIFVAD